MSNQKEKEITMHEFEPHPDGSCKHCGYPAKDPVHGPTRRVMSEEPKTAEQINAPQCGSVTISDKLKRINKRVTEIQIGKEYSARIAALEAQLLETQKQVKNQEWIERLHREQAARAEQLESQLAEAQKLLKLSSEDWAEDDTKIRDLCRPFLTEKTCDHDGYAVVPITNVVESIIKQLAEANARYSEVHRAHLLEALSLAMVPEHAIQSQ